METYSLKITKTESGIKVDEESTFSEFELIGVLAHIVNEHSSKLSKEVLNYEQLSRTEG